MPKPDPRAAIASPLFRLSESLAALRAEARFAVRFVESTEAGELLVDIERAETRAFSIADRVERGLVSFEALGHASTPLFDRPIPDHGFGVTPPLIGTAEAKGKANAATRSAEAGPGDTIGMDWPASPGSLPRVPGNPTGDPHDPATPPIECFSGPEPALKSKRTRKAKAPVVVPGSAVEGTPVVENPPPEAAEADREYSVWLPADGDIERSWLGDLFAPSILMARNRAPDHFADEVVDGTLLEVEPAKGLLDTATGRYSGEIGECASCGHRWPAPEGVGCPKCVHGSSPDPVTAGPAPVEVALPEAVPLPLSDGCRAFYRDREGREWRCLYRFQLGDFASITLDDDHAGAPVAKAIRVDPGTLRRDPSDVPGPWALAPSTT